MRKLFLLIFSMVMLYFAEAQDTTAILNAAPVLPASAEDNKDAVARTEAFIKDINQGPPLFDRFVIIGKKMWDEIKNLPNFNSIEEGNVTFKIPEFDTNGGRKMIEAKGKLLQDIVPYLKFLTYLKQNLDLDNAKVVEMNNRDKFISWLYFAKIEEPVVIIQTTKARLMLKYVKGKLFFVERVN